MSRCTSCGATGHFRESPWARDATSRGYFRRSLCSRCWDAWDSRELIAEEREEGSVAVARANGCRDGRPAQLEVEYWSAFLISLSQRADRRARVEVLMRSCPCLKERLQWIEAVDGRKLAIERLTPAVLSNSHSDRTQGHAARFAPLRDAGLVLNRDWLHMTPGAVGCALSHRAVWERIASAPSAPLGADGTTASGICSWALVLEDDLLWAAPELERRLAEVVGQLPSGWHVCYVGWHGQQVLRLALGDVSEELSASRQLPTTATSSRVFVEIEKLRNSPHPLGTFAYLVSRAGARRLMAEGAVFPLDYQLDAQLNCLCASGSLRAYRVSDEGCLFFSAPCQFVDSDVQACWSADHSPTLRAAKAALLRRNQALTAAAVLGSRRFPGPPCGVLQGQWTASALQTAAVEHPRCCIASVVVDIPGAAPHLRSRSEAAAELMAFAQWLKQRDSKVSLVIVWYGPDQAYAGSIAEAAARLHPRCSLLFQGPYEAALEAECPGSSVRGALAPQVAGFLALKPLLPLCADRVLLRGPQAALGGPLFKALLEPAGGCHAAADEPRVLVQPPPPPCPGVRAVVGPDHDVFREVCRNPYAGFVGTDQKFPPRFDCGCMLYDGRAWAPMATWVRELLRVFLRLGEATGAPVEDLLAATLLRLTGGPLKAGAAVGSSPATHVEVAARCILGLSGIAVVCLPEGDYCEEPSAQASRGRAPSRGDWQH